MAPFRGSAVVRALAALVLAIFSASSVTAQRPLLRELHRMLPRCADRTMSATAGDLDGDGDGDFVVGIDGSPWQERVLLNGGTGSFVDASAASLPVDYSSTLAVVAVDVDGDGDLDLYLGNRSQDKLYLNDGAGVFSDVTATCVPANSGTTFDVAAGDVDGDGDFDLVLGVGGQNRLLLNDGFGVFADATAARLPTASDQTSAVTLVDVDGDGDLDLAVGNAYGGQDRLCVNDGLGVFADETAQRLPVDADSANAIAAGDVDGDGDQDLVIGNARYPGPVAQQNRLYLNDGAGVFLDATGSQLPALADVTRAVALLDVDRDGDLDVWFGNDGQDRMLANDGAGRFTEATASLLPVDPELTIDITVADVDGDGDLDGLLTRSHGMSLLMWGGAGRFVDVTSAGLPRDTDSTLAVGLADLDVDGDLDLLCGNRYGSTPTPARLCLNDGAGGFIDVSANNLPSDTLRVLGIALGDVDGDGDVDALLVRSGQDLLLLNDGAARFVDATSGRLPFLADTSADVALVDVDGDGDLDAVIANTPEQNRLLVNDGAGWFADETAARMPALVDRSAAVAWADVDGDGDPDLLFANDGEQDRLYLNDGGGVFVDATATSLPAATDQTASAAFGDVDGDGDVDLILGTSQQDHLYLNDGAGVFSDATANLPTDTDDNASVDLFDVDGDGDLDVYIGNWLRRNRLYLNDGTGRMLWANDRVLPVEQDDTGDVAIGDLDQDGDLDVYVGNVFEDLVLTNLTRQLAWRAIPQLGRPLILDVYGAPGTTFVVDVAPTPARIPLPPYGVLMLDPVTASPVASGAFDGAGHGAVIFPVPADPALQGARVLWQAIGMQPLHLTNLEVTVLVTL